MAHMHEVRDTDAVFTLDAVTKIITQTSGETHITQGDHESEIITIRIPKFIEGHDMSQCDLIQIHGRNIDQNSSSSNQIINKDWVDLEDVVESDDDPDMLIARWSVTREFTKLAGTLDFKLKFVCYDETDENSLYADKKEYVLNTPYFEGLVVAISEDSVNEGLPRAVFILDKKIKDLGKKLDEFAPPDCVKTVNGIKPNENGDIEVCKRFADVGTYVNVESEPFSIEFTKNSTFASRYLEIDDDDILFKVTFNGNPYECSPRKKETDGYVVYTIGNDNISEQGGPDTGEPFYYGFKKSVNENTNDYGFIRVREHGSYTISIVKVTKSMITVPKELLPNTDLCEDLLNVGERIESGKVFSVDFTKNTSLKDNYFEITDDDDLIKVTFNGNVYNCVPRKKEDGEYVVYSIGNDDISNTGGSDTGEPFYYSFKKSTVDGISDYGIIRVREHGYYSVSMVRLTFVKIPTKLLPKNNDSIKTINNQRPDENGNIDLDTSGNVKSINNQRPDENGNIDLDTSDSIKTINYQYPDRNQNIDLCLSSLHSSVFVNVRPTYIYYKESDTDNGVERPDLSCEMNDNDCFIFTIEGFGIYTRYYNDVKWIQDKNDMNVFYLCLGNTSLLAMKGITTDVLEDTGERFLFYNTGAYGLDGDDMHFTVTGFYAVFSDGKTRSYSVEIGTYKNNVVPMNVLPIQELLEMVQNNVYTGVMTLNDVKPDKTGNIEFCKDFIGLGECLKDENVFVPRFKTTSSKTTVGYYYDGERGEEGEDPYLPRIPENHVYRITFDGKTFDYTNNDIHTITDLFGLDTRCQYIGNSSLIPMYETELDEYDLPDTGEQFVYYVKETTSGSGITIRSYLVVSEEGTHVFKISSGEPTTNKIPKHLLPETSIVIDCPEFNGQKSIMCKTLGGYTISEIQEFVKNGGIVKIKRTDGWTGVSSIDTYYYEATSFVPVVNHDQSAIVFTASTIVPSGIIVTNEYSATGELEVRCNDSFALDPEHRIIVWAYDRLIDGCNIDSDNIVEVNSWSAVQQIVRSGKASEVFNVGDQLVCTRNGKKLVWDIIGIDHDTPVDETKTHSLTLQLHDAFNNETFQFDAYEPANPDENVARAGSNNWTESNIRQWLNSDKSANNWFEPQTEYDNAPHYANIDGFLCGVDEDFLSVIGEVSKVTLKNTVTDDGGTVNSNEKFFLLSVTEVNGGSVGDSDDEPEGVPYEYYTTASLLENPSTSADASRIRYVADSPVSWWLRSPNIYTSRTMRNVGSNGDITWTEANSSSVVFPACCIV